MRPAFCHGTSDRRCKKTAGTIAGVAAALLVAVSAPSGAMADPALTPMPKLSWASTAPDTPTASEPTTIPAGSSSTVAPAAGQPSEGGIIGYLADWMERANRAQDEQPHWMTPVVTVTPRLEQEVRYDQLWEQRGNGSTLDIFDNNKGLELIPTETDEVLINPPAYQYKRNTASPANGWLDDQFLVVKQRLLSANEQNGNYIVTAFLGVTAASGNASFTNKTWLVTPTIAGGKGWGDFDIQATSGIALPFRNTDQLGKAVATNIALQYHLLTYIWPDFEFNDTYWIDGKERGGKNQLLLTPGVIFGRFVIHKRIKAIIGGGYQFAVTPKYIDTSEQTPAYNHAWIVTAGVTF